MPFQAGRVEAAATVLDRIQHPTLPTALVLKAAQVLTCHQAQL